MENNQEELIRWAINTFANNLTIYEQKWNGFSKQPYFDYRSVLKLENLTLEGRGINSNQFFAMNASIGELIERYTLFKANENSSNGCAFHTSLDQSIVNSRNELIERHFVMLFSLGYYSGQLISLDLIPQKMNHTIEDLNSDNIQLTFYHLHSDQNTNVTLCQAYGKNAKKNFGLLFGSSCKETLEESLESSLKEILPNVSAIRNGNLIPLSYSDFLSKKTISPEDHLSLYINKDFAKEYLKNRTLIKTQLNQISYNDFTYKSLVCDLNKDFFITKAFHPKCLLTQWGLIKETNHKNLNPLYPFILP